MAKVTPAAASKPKPESAAPNTPDAQTQKPVEAASGEVPKKKRTGGIAKPRVVYPGLYVPAADGKSDPTRVKLKEIPADYLPKKHKPLSRKDFEDESCYFELQAQICERKAKKWREIAEESKKLGGVGDFKAAKKLLSMQKRMNEMVLALKKDNPELNIDDMLANLTKQLEADEKSTAA